MCACAGRDPLAVLIGSAGIRTTLPLDFFASLEQHVVHGQQIYCPLGTAADFQASSADRGAQRDPEREASPSPRAAEPAEQDTPLLSGAPVIGARLSDMQAAVAHPGMVYWADNSAW